MPLIVRDRSLARCCAGLVEGLVIQVSLINGEEVTLLIVKGITAVSVINLYEAVVAPDKVVDLDHTVCVRGVGSLSVPVNLCHGLGYCKLSSRLRQILHVEFEGNALERLLHPSVSGRCNLDLLQLSASEVRLVLKYQLDLTVISLELQILRSRVHCHVAVLIDGKGILCGRIGFLIAIRSLHLHYLILTCCKAFSDISGSGVFLAEPFRTCYLKDCSLLLLTGVLIYLHQTDLITVVGECADVYLNGFSGKELLDGLPDSLICILRILIISVLNGIDLISNGELTLFILGDLYGDLIGSLAVLDILVSL